MIEFHVDDSAESFEKSYRSLLGDGRFVLGSSEASEEQDLDHFHSIVLSCYVVEEVRVVCCREGNNSEWPVRLCGHFACGLR